MLSLTQSWSTIPKHKKTISFHIQQASVRPTITQGALVTKEIWRKLRQIKAKMYVQKSTIYTVLKSQHRQAI